MLNFSMMTRKQQEQDFIRRNFFAMIQKTVTGMIDRNYPDLVLGRDSVYFTVTYTPESKYTIPETGGTVISKQGYHMGNLQIVASTTDLSQFYELRKP